ncbi:MAG: prepilin-type N-terminal cleavage/methylation domain-containing protein [Verrucomicrobiota bacterium]|jgi:prepilin-type N-terminal cleavage/methylation domain-containing protein|nr:MAG: prepilin-type N-terminal cleavage/methylation domain-containing protein [Verrucomicrobiota bacterium]
MNTKNKYTQNSDFRNKSKRGFTLIEILAVLAVIAAIIAIGVPAIARVLQSSRIRNIEGTATVLKSAITQFLSKTGSIGTIPVTEGTSTLLTSEYTGPGAPSASAVAAAATLDNLLLSDGELDRVLSLRMGTQNTAITGISNNFTWSATSQSFTATASPTLSYAAVSRAECSISDGVSNPGVTGQTAGSSACAFNINGSGTLISSGAHVAYLIIKSVPIADAYQLALNVDGPILVANTSSAPATNDQSQGAVAYAKDAAGVGYVDVYYYLTSL